MAIMYITIGAVRVVRCRVVGYTVQYVCLSTIDIIILIVDIDVVEPVSFTKCTPLRLT